MNSDTLITIRRQRWGKEEPFTRDTDRAHPGDLLRIQRLRHLLRRLLRRRRRYPPT